MKPPTCWWIWCGSRAPERGLYGAKVTGGGAGGTVAILGRRNARKAFEKVVHAYAEARHIEPYVIDGSSMGADRFGVVVQIGTIIARTRLLGPRLVSDGQGRSADLQIRCALRVFRRVFVRTTTDN